VFINPDECIDCGNCADICCQHAIFPLDDLPPEKAGFAQKNRAYFNA
jgi:ferredoxin